MKTTVLDRQTTPLERKSLDRLIEWLAARLEELDPSRPWDEVTVVLLDDEGILPVNREYFGKDRPTDVITFRYEPLPGETAFSGDILVNVQRAREEGPRHKGPDYELALYLAHGFDHLSGADDATPDQRRRMRARETAWLRRAEKEGILRPLFSSR